MFTSCGTESDNAAIMSAVNICQKKSKFVTTKVEHPAVLNVGKELERRGYKVAQIPVDAKGRLDMDRANELIDEETAVVSAMWANNKSATSPRSSSFALWRTARAHCSIPMPSRRSERFRSTSPKWK